jgi:hypothetical protein
LSFYLHEVIVFGVDADEVNGTDIEAVKHVKSDFREFSGSFRHREPVFVMAEIAAKQKNNYSSLIAYLISISENHK